MTSLGFFRRYRLWVLLAAVLLAPFVLQAAAGALGQRDNSVRQWLPEGFRETREYDWFLSHFGSEEFVVASWPGSDARDPRMQALADALRQYVVDDEGTPQSGQWFRRVVTGAELVQQLRRPPLQLSLAEAVERLQGSLLGVDGQTMGLLVSISEAGAADRHAAVATIRDQAAQVGVAPEMLRLGGPTIDSVALDQESERSRYALSAVSVVLALVVSWRCLKQWRLVVVVFCVALYAAALSLAWVHVTGNQMNLVMVTMPTLIYVLTISGAVHLTNYHAEAAAQYGAEGAAERAVAAAWLPCTLTALTTAIGLGSLALSDVVPVRMFGIYSAVGVVSSLPLLLIVLPALLSWLPQGEKAGRGHEPSLSGETGWSAWMTRSAVRWHLPITALGLACMVWAAVGVTRLQTSVKLLDFFSPQSRVLADYRWLENHLGPLVPIEMVIRIDEQDPMTVLERVALVAQVAEQLEMLPAVDGTMSAATFVPSIPSGYGVRQIAQRRVLESKLSEQREQLRAAGFWSKEGDVELWRVSARVQAMNDLDYGLFIRQLEAQVQPLLSEHLGEDPSRAVFTGVVPLIYKAQRVLLNDLTSSFVSAFLAVGLVMLLMLRGIRSGLASMLPNIFPAVIIFGVMGWTGRKLDIGSMMTASVALGIAVDDTIHFLSWFRRGLAAGMTRPAAIGWAYRHCAKAMLQTTMICGIGMLGFALSSFVPTARFAGLMSTLLGVALVGDLVFLPALLAGPLGRFFTPEYELRLPTVGTATAARWVQGWRRPAVLQAGAEAGGR